jgi:hypothetical protein
MTMGLSIVAISYICPVVPSSASRRQPDRDLDSPSGARAGWPARCEPTRGLSRRDAPLAQSPLQQPTESWVVLDQPIDQVVVFLQRHELERGSSVDSHHNRFVMAATSVLTQVRFSFTQRDHFHDAP